MSNSVITGWPSGYNNGTPIDEPKAMFMPGRIQGWPSGTQRAANRAEQLLSQAVAWWDTSKYRDGDRFLRNQGAAGELLDLGLGSSISPNSNDPLYLSWPGSNYGNYIYMPGGTLSNRLQITNETSFSITGDIDIRLHIAMDSWKIGSGQGLFSKMNAYSSWRTWVTSIGTLQFDWFNDSGTGFNALSTVPVNFSPGETAWIRFTLDVDNGSGGNTVIFYTSKNGINWTQLGDPVINSGVTNIKSTLDPIFIGVSSGNAASMKVYRAQLFNGIEGTKVLDVDTSVINSASNSSFNAITGQTVSIFRNTTGKKVTAVTAPVFLFGSNSYLEIQNNWQHNLLNFGQGDSFTIVGIWRQWNIATGATNQIVTKSWTASEIGWQLWVWSGSTRAIGSIRDSVNGQEFSSKNPIALIAGKINVAAFTLSRFENIGRVYLNNSSQGDVKIIYNGNLSNNKKVRIGADQTGPYAYSDMEFYAAAVFRRALSADEIKIISDYYTKRIA